MYAQDLLMFVPTPNKMYITVFLQMLCWFTSLLFGLWLCPLQNITKLRLENSRQKFSPTKNSLQNLTYFQIFRTLIYTGAQHQFRVAYIY
jgi:hypothetical protein